MSQWLEIAKYGGHQIGLRVAPCPFCKETEKLELEPDDLDANTRVHCQCCDAIGPPVHRRDVKEEACQAIEAWNRSSYGP